MSSKNTVKFKSTAALVLLVMVTAVWGYTFLSVQDAVSRMPVMDFLAWRFTIAALILFAVRPKSLFRMTWSGIWRGLVLGCILGSGYILQTFGLQHTYAAISGFITGMFVVFTPVFSWLILRRRISWTVWAAVVLATVGLGLLSLRGWAVGIGELLTLFAAFAYAIHVLWLGEWSGKYDVYGLTILQIGTVGVISIIAAAPTVGLNPPPDVKVWFAIGITSVLATAVAFLVQTWAQSMMSATRAAVTMTGEPVFAGIFGILLGGNEFNLRFLLGFIAILAAMVMVNLKPVSESGAKPASEKLPDGN
jgi:drug/metabolite transporter (DMT)-like permease